MYSPDESIPTSTALTSPTLVLKKHNLVTKNILRVKVMLSGEINRAINLVGIKPTKGAKAAIEAAKGTISE